MMTLRMKIGQKETYLSCTDRTLFHGVMPAKTRHGTIAGNIQCYDTQALGIRWLILVRLTSKEAKDGTEIFVLISCTKACFSDDKEPWFVIIDSNLGDVHKYRMA